MSKVLNIPPRLGLPIPLTDPRQLAALVPLSWTVYEDGPHHFFRLQTTGGLVFGGFGFTSSSFKEKTIAILEHVKRKP